MTDQVVQNSNSSAQQDALILSVIEQLKTQTSMNSLDPSPCRPTKVKVPKVSMVNTSLKKLKHHLAGFDVVIKERTMATAITEGPWGFEHTKACFRDEIILFVKALKDLFNKFDQYLIDELSEVQNVFHQMEQAAIKELLEISNLIVQSSGNKVWVFTALKDELRKLKGKYLADNVVTKNTVALEMLKIDMEPLALRLLNNRTGHSDYLRHTQDTHAHNSKLNTNSKLLCVKCNGCMLSDNHDLCVLNFINDLNARVKSKSFKKWSKKKVWKPTGKVFTNIGYTWRPTGQTFTIVGNACPLSRITITAKVPFRKPTAPETDTPKPVVTLVYSRKPRKSKTNVSASKPKIVKSISANNKETNKSWGSIVSDVPSSSLDECRLSKLFSVKFGNDHMAKILGYGDYQIGNVTISRVYFVEGLEHNLFSVRFNRAMDHEFPDAPPSPDYVPGPEHDDDEIVAEDQPYAEDASPIAQSPDYVPESDPEADPEEDGDEDPEEDPIDYPADGGDMESMRWS
ncbi:hypothetical protein Tco_0367297 [Tanacetum coccineum]